MIHDATVNNIRLHYREAGQGPALVLLHGLGSSGQIWEAFRGFRRKSRLTPHLAPG